MTSVDEVAGSNIARPGGGPGLKLGSGILGPLAVGLALLSAAVTFLVLTGLTPVLPTHEVVVTVLLANVATVLILLAIIVREVGLIVQARRHGRAGARLHVRIVGLFSVIAAVPAILVAVVASITLDRGLDRWFSSRTQALIANSLTVAQVYFREHAVMIRSDIMAMAFDIGRAKPLFDQDRQRFRQFFTIQAANRNLPNVIMIHSDLSVIERTDQPRPGHDDVLPPAAGALADVSESEPQVALLT